MKLGELVKNKAGKIYKIDSDQSVFTAVELLNKHKIGSLLVMDDKQKLAGIITERDILFKCANSIKDNKNIRVPEIMTHQEQLIIGTINDTLSYAMQVMTNKKIRHLPIVNQERVIGIVSIGDVLKEVLEQSESEIRLLREYITNPYGINL